MIFRGIDVELLKKKERSVSLLLREIAKKKKELIMISPLSTIPTNSNLNSPENLEKKNSNDINDNKNNGRNNYENMNHRFKEFNGINKNIKNDVKYDLKNDVKISNLNIDNNDDINMKIRKNSKNNLLSSAGICCINNKNYDNLKHMNINIIQLEELSGLLFTEIIILKEQQHIAESARTQYGRILRILGQLLTIVAIIRLLIGIYHVFYHLRFTFKMLHFTADTETYENIGLDDIYSINTIRNSNTDTQMWTGLGVNFVGDGVVGVGPTGSLGFGSGLGDIGMYART